MLDRDSAALGAGPVATTADPAAGAHICESDFPIAAAMAGPCALAVITGVTGPAYRPIGAAMVVDADGRCTGNLSSGCLERDVVLHARDSMASGRGKRLHYGAGSPILDITLPCGGGLEVTIIPDPDRELLRAAQADLAARRVTRLRVRDDGVLADGAGPDGLVVHIRPETGFLIFGKGAEAACFATLARQAGYRAQLFSPDPDTLARAGFGQAQSGATWPEDALTDPYTAVTLFFHDHEAEPALLAQALSGPAFYVGAQGSRRAHETRCLALREMGLDAPAIDRLASPFGLIPSTRDPRTLAVSVLAQVLDAAPRRCGGAVPG